MTDLNIEVRRYFQLMQEVAQLEEQMKKIKEMLQEQMLDHDTETLEGPGWRATWHSVSSSKFNSTKFKKDHSDLYQEYCTVNVTDRFTLNQIGGGCL